MNFEINPLLYFTSEDEMADGLEKVAGEDFGSSEAQIVHALDDLAEALGTDGFGILERSGDGTRLGEAVQSALAALEALKRAEAEVPEGAKEIRSPNLLETTSSSLPCSRKTSRFAAAGRRMPEGRSSRPRSVWASRTRRSCRGLPTASPSDASWRR